MRVISKQRAFTLISLMIGTALSMLTILAMLALYKNLVQVAVEATQDANHDGGLASALLTAQLELQSAGFGMEKGFEETVFLPDTRPINTILWYYKLPLKNNEQQCAGLIERQHPAEDKKDFRVLTLLQQSDCSLTLSAPTAANPDAGWETVTNLAVFKKLDPDQPLLSFTKSNTKCRSPYNLGPDSDPPTHPQIIITAMSSSAIASGELDNTESNNLNISYTVCLSNIRSEL